MEDLFKSFCVFGADKGAQSGSGLLDGAKFAKMAKDMKLLDKSLTATEVDIIFTKVKPKNERKINFTQFEEALKLMAAKKYPGVEDSVEKLKDVMLQGKGPVAHGVTKTVKCAAVDRLTDTSKFTGSHRERFDEEGKGKGLAGRKDVSENSGYVTGFKNKNGAEKKE